MLPLRRLSPLGLLALLAVSACVPAAMEPATPEVVARKSPVEPAETAYLSRADGAHKIPAVPLEKLPVDYRRQEVAYQTDMPPGSIVIHPGQKFLYFVTEPGKAIRYGISVGRQGFDWAGEAVVSRSRDWPTWTPPPEMIERDPKLSKWEKGQPGGPSNPLGARAIYLLSNGQDYGYRIHGTPDWWSIGKRASSGCIRMIHQDVIDLNTRVQKGAQVLVLNADGSRPGKLRVPPPTPVKKKPKPAEEVTPALATAQDAAMPTAASLPATGAADLAGATPATGTTGTTGAGVPAVPEPATSGTVEFAPPAPVIAPVIAPVTPPAAQTSSTPATSVTLPAAPSVSSVVIPQTGAIQTP